ncbi:sodium/hydrogen exchanger 3 [Dictyocaulus viviparus]|uniref:Sodium/hydrogen exchanger n=1 Tax=Dictyocaulus viviparus TaxID=29172 RepID=A0A0D8XIJ0_DICVI|nr:sodium/hydrogen exchanger 3 [Dictyocaulus viviparus]
MNSSSMSCFDQTKSIFHVFKPISNVLPDSSLLIAVGLIIGLILKQSGYFMPNRALFENVDSVVLFAVVGTIWNCLAIGCSLLVLSSYGAFTMEFSTTEIFVFSALISAVDPVAVIAVFEEINVNEFIFVNVFGEALFNDGVTVVLYQMFKSFTLIGVENLKPIDYGAGVLSFFVVACGGVIVGLIAAFIVSLITKYTNKVRILAPVFIFVVPYMAYLTAEITSLSSIIAIAVCGMVMKQYVKGNITTAAANSVKYFIKMLSQSSETVIFMIDITVIDRLLINRFLGLSTMSSNHYWDTAFVCATIGFCLLYRTIGILVQCLFLNKFRHKKFTKIDQLILSYGGLRGAIAFGLAISIPETIMARKMFITTTIVVIFFTVFLQGTTIRPLVNYLNVETKDDRPATMTESVYNKYLDYMMSGLEDIAGQQGHYSLRDNFERFNAKVLRPILMRNEEKQNFDASTIIRAYQKITLEDAMNLTKMQKAEHKRISAIRGEESRYVDGTYLNKAFEKDLPKDNDMTFLATGETVDSLYALFSELLDRKLKEINMTKEKAVAVTNEDDIHDDYMQEIASGSHLNIRQSMNSETLQVCSPYRRSGRRRSTGQLKDHKTSQDFTDIHNV